jgi:hypothetical protein
VLYGLWGYCKFLKKRIGKNKVYGRFCPKKKCRYSNRFVNSIYNSSYKPIGYYTLTVLIEKYE